MLYSFWFMGVGSIILCQDIDHLFFDIQDGGWWCCF